MQTNTDPTYPQNSEDSSQASFDSAVDYLSVKMEEPDSKISNLDSKSVDSIISDNSSSSNNIGIDEMLSLPSNLTPQCELKMKRKLRYNFMNPLQKWRVKRKYPWKLTLQIVKVILVTVQLVCFGYHSYKYVKEHNDATSTLRHIFLENWDSTRDIVAYPPSSGPYAVYTKSDFYDNIDYVVKKYAYITQIAIGSFGYDSPDGDITQLQFCKTYFRKGIIVIYNETITFENKPVSTCIEIPAEYPPNDPRWNHFSMEKFLKNRNKTINFDRMISSKLEFSMKAIFLKSLSKLESPDCYRLNVTVLYDNTKHDGEILVSLSTQSEKLHCHLNVEYDDDDDNLNYKLRQALNGIVIGICALSAILCGRSLYKAQLLRRKTTAFFEKHYGLDLTLQDKIDFIDFWFVMIIMNDILIITGSCVKIQIEMRIIEGDQYNICSILLGLGNLLVWAGILRYLGFFHKYNILILTLKRALPNVMRFMLCALLLYGGFCFCGWVVLGPYHIKFRYLSTTSECLFSLMNGDDMFATFAIIDTSSALIWWFSRAYLYLFICLFIYVVISLFISVIMDTYETIKQYYIHGKLPQTEMQRFIAEYPEDESSCCIKRNKKTNVFLSCFRNCQRRENYNNI